MSRRTCGELLLEEKIGATKEIAPIVSTISSAQSLPGDMSLAQSGSVPRGDDRPRRYTPDRVGP